MIKFKVIYKVVFCYKKDDHLVLHDRLFVTEKLAKDYAFAISSLCSFVEVKPQFLHLETLPLL